MSDDDAAGAQSAKNAKELLQMMPKAFQPFGRFLFLLRPSQVPGESSKGHDKLALCPQNMTPAI